MDYVCKSCKRCVFFLIWHVTYASVNFQRPVPAVYFVLFLICGGSDGKIPNGLSAIVLAGQAAVAASSATGATSFDAPLSLPHQSTEVDNVQLSPGEFLQALHPQRPPLKLEVLQGQHVSDESCA